jgi:hypothetical protein
MRRRPILSKCLPRRQPDAGDRFHRRQHPDVRRWRDHPQSICPIVFDVTLNDTNRALDRTQAHRRGAARDSNNTQRQRKLRLHWSAEVAMLVRPALPTFPSG